MDDTLTSPNIPAHLHYCEGLLSCAAAGKSVSFQQGSERIPVNQCLAVDPSTPWFQDFISTLDRVQAERSCPAHFSSRNEVVTRLRTLREMRHQHVRLHGADTGPDFQQIEKEIRDLATAAYPLLMLRNPTAREITIGLGRTPDQSLLIIFDEERCHQFTVVNPSTSTRLLARVLARGYLAQEIIVSGTPRRPARIASSPLLSIVFSVSSSVVAKLLLSNVLAQEGLTPHILAIPCYGEAVERPTFEGRIREWLQLRDSARVRRVTLPDQIRFERPERILKVAAALHVQQPRTALLVSEEAILHAASIEQRLWEYGQNLVASPKEDVVALAQIRMLEKVQQMQPCRFRQVVRTYRVQRMFEHEQTLNALLNAGLVTRDEDGFLRSAGDKL